LVAGVPTGLRANRAIQAPQEVEDRVMESICQFASQHQIISGIMKARAESRTRNGMELELYLAFDPRPPLDFSPYHQLVQEINSKG
jgi:hypothetical protein